MATVQLVEIVVETGAPPSTDGTVQLVGVWVEQLQPAPTNVYRKSGAQWIPQKVTFL